MIEQRRDAHRGSAGLSLTWSGLISRVRLLSRYMSVYRRLLTAGMRPLQDDADKPPPAPPPQARHKSGEEGRAGMVTAATAAPGAPGGLRGILEAHRGSSLPEGSSLLRRADGTIGGDGSSGEGSGGGGRGGGGGGEEQWGPHWVGGSSAEIRKLAEQIRTRFGRGAMVRKRYGTGARRELQARKNRTDETDRHAFFGPEMMFFRSGLW